MDLEHEIHEEEDVNMDRGNRGNDDNDHRDNGAEDFPIRVPRGVEPGRRGNPQPQPVRREYLCERFYKMKPPSFKGFTNSLDAEEWLSTIEIILNFMELNDEGKIICAAYVLGKEACYWWEAVKTRRNV